MRNYEVALIVRPEAEHLAEGKEYLKNLFGSAGCKVLKEEDMGNRELAYEIKKSKRGHYLVYELEAGPETVKVLEKSLKMRNEILKCMVYRKEG